MKLWILFAAAILAAPVHAQSKPSDEAAQLDPEAMEAARDLLRGLGLEKQMEANARESVQATFDTMVATTEEQHGIELPVDLRAKLRGILMETVDATVAE